MSPRFTLRYADGTFAHALSSLHAALIAWGETGDRYPTRVWVETPTRGPRIVHGFTGDGIPLVAWNGEILPLY